MAELYARYDRAVWRAAGIAWLCLAAIAGCGRASSVAGPPKAPSAPESSAPEAAVSAPAKMTIRERLRSGSFQVQASLDSLEEAVKKCREILAKASGPEKEALQDILDKLNGIGDILGDRSAEPPSQAEIDKNPAQFEKLAKDSQDDAEDSMTELTQVMDSLDTLVQSVKDDQVEPLDGLRTLVEAVMQDVSGARDAFAGVDSGGQ